MQIYSFRVFFRIQYIMTDMWHKQHYFSINVKRKTSNVEESYQYHISSDLFMKNIQMENAEILQFQNMNSWYQEFDSESTSNQTKIQRNYNNKYQVSVQA